ncbi:hypothetical protein [Streptomyces sp. RerS4]|uniref:hypothetical protein n=1 Tax=Streptomyces sp. RerS4 TaxID=2942449 RepID=UPI00201C82FB|nr:hypothetical protein [Streptomyces sp. RerS4]UQX05240.1 hypothetical protein M4D82_28840 [Streptomyces sp. RerS4]
MELLHARHGSGLRTAALLRRSHPFDKELQVAGLLQGLDGLSSGGDGAAEAVRGLLGERVARLLRAGDPAADAPDVEALRLAAQTSAIADPDAGVVEDWRPVLELIAAGAYQI